LRVSFWGVLALLSTLGPFRFKVGDDDACKHQRTIRDTSPPEPFLEESGCEERRERRRRIERVARGHPDERHADEDEVGARQT